MLKKIYLSTVMTVLTVWAFAQTVTYTESFDDFMNPDRGFYTPFNGVASSFTPLSQTQLESLRTTSFTPWGGTYTVRTAIILRHYVLDSYVTSAIPQSFLDKIGNDFNIARAAGVRMVLRFSYTITPNTGSCGSWICPPYGDASKSIVLGHISQLKPYLQNNSDVILAVQNGFIGVWGEQYYTDHFGDASVQGKLNDQNWADRIDVLAALLDAVPSNRMVQVRYPQMKQKYIYGISASVNSSAMTSGQAHNGSDIARIGHHNDCFLSASDDQGTYWDYGTSSTSASNQTTVLKPYTAEDSKYVIQGGETCSDVFSPQNDCSGQAVYDMNLLNYTYLNSDYNNDVNNDWESGGCMNEVKRRLGYRFVMRNGTYPTSVTAGGSLAFSLNVDNVGFAAPANPRQVELVLRNTSTSTEYKVALSADTRFWLAGQSVTVSETVTVPSGVPTGDYELFLHLKDNSNDGAVANRPEYSLRFANIGTWESSTGYNALNHTISVGTGGGGGGDGITVDGETGDWSGIATISTSGTNLTSLKADDNATNLYLLAEGTLSTNYQVFIDTDNNSSGSNEYTGSIWSSTGFNYMIENGTLYLYTGTGSSWSWSSQGSVSAVKTSSVLEMGIAKSMLGTLGADIRVAVASLNSSYSTVGSIPSGTSGALYTLTPSSLEITVDGQSGDWSGVNPISTSGSNLTSLKAADNSTNLYVLAEGSLSTNYQVFIDTDNNASGSNEYTGSNWSSTGFNFMVENGTLYQYTGNGSSWSWSSLGSVTAAFNSSILELGVAKTSLGSLASTVNISVASLNSSYSMVGYIPSGTSGAPYVIGSAGSRLAEQGGIQEEFKSLFRIYPNPTTDYIRISQHLYKEGLVSVEIIGLDGRKYYESQELLSEGNHLHEIPVYDLPKGMLLVRVTANGEMRLHKVVRR